MLSSLNAFGGLSAADILMLFGSNSSSSFSNSASTTAPSTQTGIDASGTGNPPNALQAILAQADIAQARAAQEAISAVASIVTAQAAYAEQTGDSNSLASASAVMDAISSVTNTNPTITRAKAEISSPGAVQSAASEQWVSDVSAWTADTTQTGNFNSFANAADVIRAISGSAEAAVLEPWMIDQATEAASAAVSVLSASEPANGTSATISAQELTENAGTGESIFSILGQAVSSAEPANSSSSASATATFLEQAAYQQIMARGGSAISLTEATDTSQTGSSGSLDSANVTLSLPDAAQQIAFAVTEVDDSVFSDDGWVSATTADAVNVTIADGTITGSQGGTLPDDLPSLSTIQQAIDEDAEGEPQSYAALNGLDLSTYDGSLTLVKLAADSNSAEGDNFVVLAADNQWGSDADDKWAVVLPQDEVTVTISNTQTTVSNTQING